MQKQSMYSLCPSSQTPVTLQMHYKATKFAINDHCLNAQECLNELNVKWHPRLTMLRITNLSYLQFLLGLSSQNPVCLQVHYNLHTKQQSCAND
jgi:hypothetical protein